ncbi:hypothetical protein JYU34_021671 [Plutella xylostella]|uniref:Fatty acyl-CoA reductase n=1 Tax=Plutella xylostella TaxID=51655 RepID=A0ABQ7PR68_PLUXY|nr:hypothetical protein JYU34_021671 [Plutella xylostella]
MAIDNEDKSAVAEYFAGKSVLVTGATGFVGKVLLEKLLRCCPGVETIYLLMRKKRGVSPDERIKTFLQNPLFDTIRTLNPKTLDKVRLVPGDILLEELGLSSEDRVELQNKCHVVFHSAACVRFDQKLKDAVDLNTRGSYKILQLAESMKNLQALVHLSTAYCRCELPCLEERVYPALHPPAKIMDMVRWLDDQTLDYLEPKIIGTEPNTYSYTKALTESLVAEFGSKIPIAIARPSIITAIWKEPIPGWVDNLNGPTGLLMGAGKGVIRSMHCEPSYQCDAMPVDVVANGCILVAYATAMDRPKEVQVYNITLSGVIRQTWGEIIEKGREMVNKYPLTVALWYTGGSIKSYKWSHQLSVVFTHYLPAYLVDGLLLVMGKKTFLVKVQDRISHGIKILQHYTQKEWHFTNDKFLALQNRISEFDRSIFYIDVKPVNMNAYMRNYVLGVRQYCCKEDPSTLAKARKIHKVRYLADVAVKVFFYAMLLWLLVTYSYIFTSALETLETGLTNLSPFRSVKAYDIEELAA